MYYAEHGVPHFHALYAGEEASIAIDTLEVLAGGLPDRALGSCSSGQASTVPNSNWIGTALVQISRSSRSNL